jgi:hypothetical protein
MNINDFGVSELLTPKVNDFSSKKSTFQQNPFLGIPTNTGDEVNFLKPSMPVV